MYQLNFSKDMHLINWSVLFCGIEKELISPDTAIEYANKLIEKNPDEDENYDTSKHTQKENEQRLIDNLNEFIVQKGKEIK